MSSTAVLNTTLSLESAGPDEVLQLPDIQFVNYCFKAYGLNRGIYNTIDEWFYFAGVRSITERRQAIVAFLAEQRQADSSPGTYLKFGKGGLTKQLLEFAQRGSGRTPLPQ